DLFDRSGIVANPEGYTETSFVYDQAGRLLRRQTTGRNAETFVYDGLGRVVASIDVNGGRTEIAFNDAGMQTIIVQANGYTK
ncbi:hypothetical protein, partial [Escherichia coli]|uniref:hypothetical protein n=1 Tax=Escherichia coli TaxID=562 RepID=UPI001954103B